MKDHPDCSSDDDLRIANRVMLEGDLPHAAFHVAAALNIVPQHVEALALADELFHLSKDPLALAPLEPESNFTGTVALRARFLQRLDRHNEALVLIADNRLNEVEGMASGFLITCVSRCFANEGPYAADKEFNVLEVLSRRRLLLIECDQVLHLALQQGDGVGDSYLCRSARCANFNDECLPKNLLFACT